MNYKLLNYNYITTYYLILFNHYYHKLEDVKYLYHVF